MTGCLVYYPYDLVRDSPLTSPGAASPEEILAGLDGPQRGYDDEIQPRLATAEERRILSLAQVSVVLELARTAYTADRGPVLVSHQIRRVTARSTVTRSRARQRADRRAENAHLRP